MCIRDRDHITHLVLGTLVELLGECHDVDTLLTQSRANRGSRSCLADVYKRQPLQGPDNVQDWYL